jgi:hypothetical protein
VAQRNDRPAAFLLRTEFGLQVRLPQIIYVSTVYRFDLCDCDASVTVKEGRANEISITCEHSFPRSLFILRKDF